MPHKEFLQKLRQLPIKIEQYKIISIGNFALVKASNVADYLATCYKIMPELMRDARKKGMRSSIDSFRLLTKVDKMFIAETFPQNIGIAFIRKHQFAELISDICSVIPSDLEKLKNMNES